MEILLIHASAGAGHRKAAEGIYNSLQGNPDIKATLVDALDYTSPFYKKIYRETYSFLISKLPWMWAFFFGTLDVPCLLPLVKVLRRFFNTINAQPLARFLKEKNFDCIISTHFFPNEVAAALKRKGLINSKLISVVTDFDVHSIWVAQGIEHYAVASDWTKAKIKTLGVNEDQIFVTGIPTDEKFSLNRDKSELKKKLGVEDNVFTVLVATGSFGIGPIEEIIDALEGEFQVLVVCGHNKSLYKRLSKQSKKLVKILGLVDNMDELMAVSNAMVTKPGGLSISEALVSQLPLIFFNAIPGQETSNIMVLKEYGIGISDCSIEEIAEQLRNIKASSQEYNAIIEKIKVLARPSAVKDIINIIHG